MDQLASLYALVYTLALTDLIGYFSKIALNMPIDRGIVQQIEKM